MDREIKEVCDSCGIEIDEDTGRVESRFYVHCGDCAESREYPQNWW